MYSLQNNRRSNDTPLFQTGDHEKLAFKLKKWCYLCFQNELFLTFVLHMGSFKTERPIIFIHPNPKTANSLPVNPLTLKMEKQVLNPCPELGQTVMRLWVSHVQAKYPNQSRVALPRSIVPH